MGLMKDVHLPVTEQTRLQFRADAFSVINHPNFGPPNANTDSASMGTITKAFSQRQIQLGLQLFF